MDDETEIGELHQKFAGAWTHGELGRIASSFAEDAIRIGTAGRIQQGRSEIVAAFEKLLSGPMQGTMLTLEWGTTRLLSPGLALWRGNFEILPPEGKPPLRGYVVDVMSKLTGRWLILETHPKIFPAPVPETMVTQPGSVPAS